MGAEELDGIDTAIVGELQADGRIPFETLAARVGLSRAAARLRFRRMQEGGRLAVVGIVHPAVRGTTALAHAWLSASGPAAEAARAAAAVPGTRVWQTAGRHPLFAEIRGSSLDDLSAAVERLRAAPGIAGGTAAVCTQVLKDPRLAAADPPDSEPDDVDRVLLDLLEADGRRSFAELAAAVGLSAGAVRARVLRLLGSGALRITAVLEPFSAGHSREGGFALRADGAARAVAAAAAWPEIRFLCRSLGPHDLVGIAAAPTVDGLHEVFERLRGLPGVRLDETWIRLTAPDVPPEPPPAAAAPAAEAG